MAERYVDFEGGNDANDGLSFANRQKNLLTAITAASAGDEIRVMASQNPVNTNISGGFNFNSDIVSLFSPLTLNLYNDGAWTGVTNVTTSTNTTRMEGSTSASFAFAAGFTTGKFGFYTLPSSTDLSPFNTLSAYFRITPTANITGISFYLCSDISGNEPLSILQIPTLGLLNQFLPISITGNLTTGVNSIGLYINNDPGTSTFLLDNLFVSSGINLNSLIGFNNNLWFPIKSISGNIIRLSHGPINTAVTTERGYPFDTQSGNLYYLNPIDIGVTGTTQFLSTTKNVTNPITINGGYDRTGMNTRVFETWYSAPRQWATTYALLTNSNNLIFDNINFSKFNIAYTIVGTSSNIQVNNYKITHHNSSYFNLGTSTSNIKLISGIVSACSSTATITTNTTTGCFISGFTGCMLGAGGLAITTCTASIFSDIYIKHIFGNHISLTTAERNNFYNITLDTANGGGITFNAAIDNNFYNTEIKNCTTSQINFVANSYNNSFYHIYTSGLIGINDNGSFSLGNQYLYNWKSDDTTEVSLASRTSASKIISINHDRIHNNNYMFYKDGLISTISSGDGIVWKLEPTSNNRNRTNPITLDLGLISLKPNEQITVSSWVTRNNSEITGWLMMDGYQISGINQFLTHGITGVNQWERLNLTLTPSGSGVVNFHIDAWGGVTGIFMVSGFNIE